MLTKNAILENARKSHLNASEEKARKSYQEKVKSFWLLAFVLWAFCLGCGKKLLLEKCLNRIWPKKDLWDYESRT